MPNPYANAVMLFTYESLAEMFRRGGTEEWTADAANLRKCIYVIGTRNARDAKAEDRVPHRHDFMVGRLGDVKKSRNGKKLITMTHYAEIAVPNLWPGFQNPVTYVKVEETLQGVAIANLDWKPWPCARS